MEVKTYSVNLRSEERKQKASNRNFKLSYQNFETIGSFQYIPYFASEPYRDAFPYYLIDLIGRSSTLATCLDLHARIIKGDGFKVLDFEKFVINQKGHTVQDLLNQIVTDYVYFGGVSIHLNFNIKGEVVSVEHTPFERIRLGVPEGKNDEPNKIGYILKNDYLSDTITPLQQNTYVDIFDRYNSTKQALEKIGKLQKEQKFTEYNGQMYVYMSEQPGARWYPKPDYYSCIQDAEAEGDIKRSLRFDIEDRFKPTTVIVEYGLNNDDKKRIARIEQMSEYSGTDAPRILYITAPNPQSKPDIIQLPQQNIHQSYEVAEKSRQDNIRRKFKYPDVLYGIAQAGKLGQTEELETSVQYANTIALPDRYVISKIFKCIFENFKDIQSVNPTKNFDILDWQLFKTNDQVSKPQETETAKLARQLETQPEIEEPNADL